MGAGLECGRSGGAIAEYLDSLRKEAEADGAAEAELEDDDEEDAETA